LAGMEEGWRVLRRDGRCLDWAWIAARPGV
jgi:hypothetical protein